MQPTKETYTELQRAYDFFNKKLFGGDLPECLITLQRKKSTLGYYSPERFISNDSQSTDEIAMNPQYFAVRTAEDVLSTLVHEMTHLWQRHKGYPGRGRYHNKEWSNRMESIGLMPSNTGKPGGKRTGDNMSHYIIECGPFDMACQELLTEKFRISWADRFQVVNDGNDIKTLKKWGIEVESEGQKNKSNRVKYSCPVCHVNVWGKADIKLICADCCERFFEV